VKYLNYAIITLLLAGMFFWAAKAYTETKAYERATYLLITEMSVEKLAKFQMEELAETVSFGIYKNKAKERIEMLKEEQQRHKAEARTYTFYALLFLPAVLASYLFVSLRAFTFFSAVGALITLFFGLVTPIMMVTIHKKVAYLGDVALSFESKGIAGSISKLFENGDSVVAGVILLFSVIVPLCKTLSMMAVSVFRNTSFAHGIVRFFKSIGKWSMVDVFVVATFLVYLTVDKGDLSRAEVEPGLYFFLAYVIVSMLVSLSADKMLHQIAGKRV